MACNTESNDIEDLDPEEAPSIEGQPVPKSSKPSPSTSKTACDCPPKPKIDADLKKQLVPDESADKSNRSLSQLSTVPGGIVGSHSVFVKTWGCSHNWSDSEYMAGILMKNGYRVTFEEEESADANIWVLNSCTVKGRAQNLFETALKKAKSLHKFVVAAGCVPSGEKKNALWSDVSIIGVQQIDQINYVVQQTLAGNVIQLLKNKKVSKSKYGEPRHHEDGKHGDNSESSTGSKRKAGGAPLSMPKLRRNALEEIVPINTGCLNQVCCLFALLVVWLRWLTFCKLAKRRSFCCFLTF